MVKSIKLVRKCLRREEKGSKISVKRCYAVGFTLCISPGRTTKTIFRFLKFSLFSICSFQNNKFLYRGALFKERRNVVVLA